MDKANTLIKNFSDWAEAQDNILAVGLVGSYARGDEKEDSDIDLMIIIKDQDLYINDDTWINKFGEVDKIIDEEWGQLKTKRVFYKDGLEVEFNFDKKSWVNPKDSGTKRVVTDGMKILVDKDDLLEKLILAFKH
jgi:predicted nucleotidyltransferase